MHNHLQVETRHEGAEVAVLVTRGEPLDLASSQLLEAALDDAIASEAQHVIVDLRGLQFIDSIGLSVLIKADRRLRESGRRFGLVRGGSQVQRLLGLTGLASRVSLADTPEQLIIDT